jgi:hypothetical protein
MLWIACLAVILAGVRRNEFFPALLTTIAYFVLALDLFSVAIEWLTGQSVYFACFSSAERRIRTRQQLWAVVDGYPIRVELAVPIQTYRDDVEFGRIGDRVIDGRTMLCDVSHGTPRPLDLMDRGSILVYHERHGLCLVQPLLLP